MSGIGMLSVVGLVVIVLALVAWILAVFQANRHAAQTEHPDEKLKRGPVSGGAIHGDPGQTILTGEAPRRDKEPRNGPLDL